MPLLAILQSSLRGGESLPNTEHRSIRLLLQLYPQSLSLTPSTPRPIAKHVYMMPTATSMNFCTLLRAPRGRQRVTRCRDKRQDSKIPGAALMRVGHTTAFGSYICIIKDFDRRRSSAPQRTRTPLNLHGPSGIKSRVIQAPITCIGSICGHATWLKHTALDYIDRAVQCGPEKAVYLTFLSINEPTPLPSNTVVYVLSLSSGRMTVVNVDAAVAVYSGDFVHSTKLGEIRFEKAKCVGVAKNGRISFIADADRLTEIQSAAVEDAKKSGAFFELGADEFYVPGLVDTHIHAPQYPFLGTGLDKPLMEWLHDNAWPHEKKVADLKVAADVYRRVIQGTLKQGTTTALYFQTIHPEPTMLFADLLEELGQRGFVGTVAMDRNSPEDYISECQEAIENSEKIILYIKEKQYKLAMPVITPRFIPTCSENLLAGLSRLSEQYDVPIQSHVSESCDEVAFVEKLHPGERDTHIFGKHGMLKPGTCLAHGVHLRDDELSTFAEKGASIAHCPLSNWYLGDGALNVRKAMNKGVKIGLGTDVAGGYSSSILSVARHAVVASLALGIFEKEPRTILSYKEAFWLATMGGASALNLQDKIGSFEVGKFFDALHISCRQAGDGDSKVDHNIEKFGHEDMAQMFEKFMHLGDDRNIERVFVSGRLVHQR